MEPGADVSFQAGDVILSSGSARVLRRIHAAAPAGVGLIHCVTRRFAGSSGRKSHYCALGVVAGALSGLGMRQCLVRHADFGGCTDAQHLILWNDCIADDRAFAPPPSTPKVLADVIDPTI